MCTDPPVDINPIRASTLEQLPWLGHVSDTGREFADALARTRSEDQEVTAPKFTLR
jgi:hypothetical protein